MSLAWDPNIGQFVFANSGGGFVVGGGRVPKQCSYCFGKFIPRTGANSFGFSPNSPPHDKFNCPNPQNPKNQSVQAVQVVFVRGAQGIGGGQPTKRCKICNRTNHRTRDCRHNPQAQGGGAAQGGGGRGGQLVLARNVPVVQVGGGAPVAAGGRSATLSQDLTKIWYEGVEYPVKKIDVIQGQRVVEFERPGGIRQRTQLF